jgi:hypothetical protein
MEFANLAYRARLLSGRQAFVKYDIDSADPQPLGKQWRTGRLSDPLTRRGNVE